MKILSLTIAAVLFTCLVQAQGGMRQRTVEERVATVHQKADSVFKFDAAKQAKVDSVFAGYYRKQDKLREELRNNNGGERPDFQAMREKMQPLIEARDKELQGILTGEEYKKWKDQLEPALMPRRNGGGNRQ